jgi:hypothetical protein
MPDNMPVKPDCPCTEECERHGKCKLCHEYHHAKGDAPYCKRSGPPAGGNMPGEHHHHGPHHDHMHEQEHGHP